MRSHWIARILSELELDLARIAAFEASAEAARQRGDIDTARDQIALAAASRGQLARRVAVLRSSGVLALFEALTACLSQGNAPAFSELRGCLSAVPRPEEC